MVTFMTFSGLPERSAPECPSRVIHSTSNYATWRNNCGVHNSWGELRMRLVQALLAVCLVLILPLAGMAEEAPPDTELQSLLKVLEDDAARSRLIGQIKTLQETQPQPVSAPLHGVMSRVGEKLSSMRAEDFAQAIGLSLAILVAAWLAARFLAGLLDRGLGLLMRHEESLPGLAARAARYQSALKGLIRIGIGLGALVGILEVLGTGILTQVNGPQGRHVLFSLLTILLVTGGALALWELAGAALERSLKRLDGQGRRHGRLKTLAPLLRTLVAVVLAAMCGLTVLSELGVNIAPLLAGAGMIGLAFGLGAQKLVQDLLGSISMLIEDTLAVGDVIKVGEHTGAIEKMTLMDIQLRDQYGYLHIIPFSKIDSFVNMTVDFAYAVFEVGVAYRENIDNVMKVLTDLGAALAEDEEFGQLILEPMEMLGLE
ncbi:MAG: mechanosensitive ion channel, partial [Rhodospirillales bacterium]